MDEVGPAAAAVDTVDVGVARPTAEAATVVVAAAAAAAAAATELLGEVATGADTAVAGVDHNTARTKHCVVEVIRPAHQCIGLYARIVYHSVHRVHFDGMESLEDFGHRRSCDSDATLGKGVVRLDFGERSCSNYGGFDEALYFYRTICACDV